MKGYEKAITILIYFLSRLNLILIHHFFPILSTFHIKSGWIGFTNTLQVL